MSLISESRFQMLFLNGINFSCNFCGFTEVVYHKKFSDIYCHQNFHFIQLLEFNFIMVKMRNTK